MYGSPQLHVNLLLLLDPMYIIQTLSLITSVPSLDNKDTYNYLRHEDNTMISQCKHKIPLIINTHYYSDVSIDLRKSEKIAVLDTLVY